MTRAIVSKALAAVEALLIHSGVADGISARNCGFLSSFYKEVDRLNSKRAGLGSRIAKLGVQNEFEDVAVHCLLLAREGFVRRRKSLTKNEKDGMQ